MNPQAGPAAGSEAAPAMEPRAETGCCPRFDPTPWQDQLMQWHDKPFVRRRVHSFFHIPLGLPHVFAEEQALIANEHAQAADRIVLSDENSLWGADYYFSVSGVVHGAEMVELSGTFLTHVFEGPYRNMAKWTEEMRDFAAARGADVDKLYAWYTTCPKCAKAYGENYVVLFAKLG